jgi:hypothetical protein
MSKNWEYQLLVKIWSNQNSYLLLLGKENLKSILETVWHSYTSYIILPHDPALVLLWKCMATQNLHMNVCTSFIHNHSKLEATIITTMDKQIGTSTDKILFCKKANMWLSHKYGWILFYDFITYNSCTGGYIMIFTYVFKIYLSWIYLLHCSPSSSFLPPS